MKYVKIVLDNGLRVIVVPIPSIASATLAVWVRTGSRFEEKNKNGISHFLEHMVFKGSKKRPSAHAISSAVDSLGGEFNAGTSKEWTNFYIKARAGVMPEAFDILSDMVLNPIIDKEEVEREKGVIIEEIAMYDDTPLFKIGDLFENVIFKGSSLGWDIAGTAESVRGISRDDFGRYRKKHYYADNMLVTVTGGVKKKDVLGLVSRYLGDLKKDGRKQIIPNVKFNQKKPKVLLKSKKTDQTHILIGFRGDPLGSKDRYAEGLLNTILGGGMSSRLFIEVRERRALAYAVKTSSDHNIDSGYLATYAGVRTKSATEAIKVILDQCYGLADKKYPISNKEIKKAKDYIKGHIALSLEDTKDVGAFFGMEELLLGKVRTPQEVFNGLDKVSVDEVVSVAKRFFKPQNLNLAVYGPQKNKAVFEKTLT